MKKEIPEIKIIEPYTPDEIIECDSKDDFIEIINADKEKYESMTTQKLNKLFSIPGYKITKLKGEIGLRSDKYCAVGAQALDKQNILNETYVKQNELKEVEKSFAEQISRIKKAFNELSEQFEYIKKYIKTNF